jgi:PPOX class probable FMN-dependent enzyme
MTDTIATEAQLDALLGPVSRNSQLKETATLNPAYRRWIERSPFAVVATSGPEGLDASPRGDPAPLVRVLDERTILLPERNGNNRADGLRNLLADPRIALIFLIPGVGETLRVNGRATITADPALLASFAVNGKPPRCVLRISVEKVFFQCSRATLRSRLWDAESRATRGEVPTAGEMLAVATAGEVDAASYDETLPGRLRAGLY